MSTKTSKLQKPSPTTLPSGRRIYPGSISDMGGGVLSKKQQKAILSALSDGPKFPTALEIEGITQFSVHAQQGLHSYLQELGTNGLAQFSKTGWQLSETGQKFLKDFDASTNERSHQT